jgi:hypothetical protein
MIHTQTTGIIVLLLIKFILCDHKNGWPRLTSDKSNTCRAPFLTAFTPIQLSSININDQQTGTSINDLDQTPIITDEFGNSYVMYSNTSRFFIIVASYDSFNQKQRWIRSFYVQKVLDDTLYASMSLIYTTKTTIPIIGLYISNTNQVHYLLSDSGRTLQTFDLSLKSRSFRQDDEASLGVIKLTSDLVQDDQWNSFFGCGSSVCSIKNNFTLLTGRKFQNWSVKSSPALWQDLTMAQNDLVFTVFEDELPIMRPAILLATYQYDLSIAWQLEIMNYSRVGTPALFNTSIFLTANNSLFCVSVLNGTFIWSKNMSTSLGSRIAVGHDRLVVTSYSNSYLYSVNTSDGSVLWSRQLLPYNISSDIIIGDPIVTGNDNTLVSVVDRSKNIVEIFSFDQFGNNYWKLQVKSESQIQRIGPLSISRDGVIYFKMISTQTKLYKPGVQNLTSTVIRIGQLVLDSIAPSNFYSDEKQSGEIILTGRGFTLAQSNELTSTLMCVIIPDSQKDTYVLVTPSSVSNTTVKCSISAIPDQLFVPNALLHVYLSLEVNISEHYGNTTIQHTQKYKTEYKTFRVFAPISIESFAPYAIPVSSYTDIRVLGSRFLEMSPQAKSAACRFTKKNMIIDDNIEEFITQGVIRNDNIIDCAVPHGEGANGIFMVEVSVNNIPPRTLDPHYFKAPQVFDIYDIPNFTQVIPSMFPIEGGTKYNLTITKYDDRLMRDKLIIKKCRFDDDPGSVSEAICKIIGDTVICTCFSMRTAQRKDSIRLFFSQNSIHFNDTGLQPIHRYKQPQLYGLDPSVGNVTGGTRVTVIGLGFFTTPYLKCKFGSIEVPAVYQSPEKVECSSPIPLPGQERVSVQVSQNGIDYTSVSNITFTYKMLRNCPGDPFECSGHGICNENTGKCECIPLKWTGQACEIPYDQRRIGYWNVVGTILGIISLIFVLFVVAVGLYYNHRRNEYKRLVTERQKNDISTAL